MPFELQRRLQEVGQQDRDSEIDGDNADAVGKCRLYKDAAIQACFDQYINATSQTDFPDVRSAIHSEQNNIERQPSRIQKRNKSISISPKNSDTRPSRKRQQDQELQAEMANFTTAGQTEAPESNSLPLGINLPNPDSDFPLLSVSISPDQHSPDMGNPQTSVDRGVVSNNEVSTRPQHKIDSASQEPFRCILCSREIKNTTRKPQLGVSIETEPIYEHNAKPAFENRYEEETGPSLRSTWSQAGLVRSTLECQQCAHPELCNAHLATNLEVELEEILKRYYPPEERFLQRKVIQDTMEKYAKQPPVADPVKKPPLPSRSRLRPPPTNRSTTKHNREAPAVPDAVIPQSDISSSVLTRDSSGISNQDVLRGLHVATAAACDEGVAKWIEEITGTGVRGFLADLSAYNGLGCNTLARVARRAAKRRREAVLLERTWEKRPQSGGDDGAVDYADDIRIVKAHDNATKMGCGVGDDVVDVRVKRKESGRGKGQVRDGVIATR